MSITDFIGKLIEWRQNRQGLFAVMNPGLFFPFSWLRYWKIGWSSYSILGSKTLLEGIDLQLGRLSNKVRWKSSVDAYVFWIAPIVQILSY